MSRHEREKAVTSYSTSASSQTLKPARRPASPTRSRTLSAAAPRTRSISRPGPPPSPTPCRGPSLAPTGKIAVRRLVPARKSAERERKASASSCTDANHLECDRNTALRSPSVRPAETSTTTTTAPTASEELAAKADMASEPPTSIMVTAPDIASDTENPTPCEAGPTPDLASALMDQPKPPVSAKPQIAPTSSSPELAAKPTSTKTAPTRTALTKTASVDPVSTKSEPAKPAPALLVPAPVPKSAIADPQSNAAVELAPSTPMLEAAIDPTAAKPTTEPKLTTSKPTNVGQMPCLVHALGTSPDLAASSPAQAQMSPCGLQADAGRSAYIDDFAEVACDDQVASGPSDVVPETVVDPPSPSETDMDSNSMGAIVSSTSGDTIRPPHRAEEEPPVPPVPTSLPSTQRGTPTGEAGPLPEPSDSSVSVLTPSPSWPNDSIASVDTSVSASRPTSTTTEFQRKFSLAEVLIKEDISKPTRLAHGISCVIAPKLGRFRALIKYIGHVPGRRGVWIGVEIPAPFPRALEALPLARTARETSVQLDQDGTFRTDGLIEGQRFFSLGERLSGGSMWLSPFVAPSMDRARSRSSTGGIPRPSSQEHFPRWNGGSNNTTIRGRRSSPGLDSRTRPSLPPNWTGGTPPAEDADVLNQVDFHGIPNALAVQRRQERWERVQRLLALSGGSVWDTADKVPPSLDAGRSSPLTRATSPFYPLGRSNARRWSGASSATGAQRQLTDSPPLSFRSASPLSAVLPPRESKPLGLFIRPQDVLVVVGPD